MNYYFLRFDVSGLGISHQIKGQKDGPYYGTPQSITSWLPPGERYPEDLNVKCFEMIYGTKRTDYVLVSSGFRSNLLSQRFFEILQLHKLCDIQFFKSSVEHRKKTYPYTFFYIVDTNNNFIDFNRSLFYIGEGAGYKTEDIVFDSYESYTETREKHLNHIRNGVNDAGNVITRADWRFVFTSELYLDEKQIGEYDFFYLSDLCNEMVVSERLKEAIESAELTGVTFVPAQGHRFPMFDIITKKRLQ